MQNLESATPLSQRQMSRAGGLVAAAPGRALRANTDQLTSNHPHFLRWQFRMSLHAHKQNSQHLNGELKLKDPLVMSSAPRKRFISNNNKKIITVDKVLVNKLQFCTPGLPQDNNIIFPQ